MGIPGFVVTVVALIRSRIGGGKRLTHEIVSDVGVINTVKDLRPDVNLTVGGVPMNDARMVMLRLSNVGSEPVSQKDLTYPLSFEFKPASLVSCAIHSTEPPNLIREDLLKSLIRMEGRSEDETAETYKFAELTNLSLRPRSSIELKFLSKGHSELNVVGDMPTGDIVPYAPPTPHPKRNAAIIAGSIVFGMLLAFEIVAIGGFFQSCAIGPVPLNVNGSSAFYATARAEADAYHASCPVAFVNVGSSSSGAGLHMLSTGAVQVADSELSAEEASYGSAGFVEHRVALIVFGIIVNNSVSGIHSLTRAQIAEIYSGAITNWDQVPGGPNVPITTVGRPSDSGTQNAFTRFVLGQQRTTATVVESGTDEVLSYVSDHLGTIGYVDLGAADAAGSRVVTIAIDGTVPTVGQVRQGQYPFWAIERMYTRSSPDALAVSYINRVARDVQTSDSFIKIQDVPVEVLASHG